MLYFKEELCTCMVIHPWTSCNHCVLNNIPRKTKGVAFHSINTVAFLMFHYEMEQHAQEYLRPTSADLKFSGQQSRR